MQRGLSRRAVMGLFSWTSLAALLGCGPPAVSGSGRRVLVLGGGVAGLSAAYELGKLGFEVTVLEGQERIGGRVWTVREGFEQGQYAEVGAVRIGDSHLRLSAYVDELGLEFDVWPDDGVPIHYIDDQRFQWVEGEPWPIQGLNPEELNASLGDLVTRYVYDHIDEFGDPSQGEFPAGIVDKYDALTQTEYLQSRGASEAFLKLYAADNGTEVYTIGALAWMMAEAIDYSWTETRHIRGGNDNLTRRLAEEVGMDNILLGHKVVKIAHTDAGVTVTAEVGGESVEFAADYLVCTLPFPILKDIPVEPAFAEDKVEVIGGLKLMNAGRGYIQTKTRFWKEEGLGGLKLAKTDLPVERIWNTSEIQDAGTTMGMIVSYTMHENADAYCELPVEEREGFTLDHVEKFFPQIKDEKVAFFHWCWREDPWARGAWTDYLPNQWWMFAVARRPEGRVHFAGEHTSAWAGWMEGGIDSGQRAAREIADLVGEG